MYIYTQLADKLSNSISAKGFMLGYVAALFLLIVSVVIIVLVPASTHDYYEYVHDLTL